MDDLKLYGKNKKEIESLTNTVKIYSDDIGMKFGLQKCASILMERGKKVSDCGITLTDGSVIDDLQENGYKYLGILEADSIQMKNMKTKICKEYHRRTKRILRSKLNARNTIDAINTWAISLIRYTAGIVDWNQEELQQMDRKTRKVMTMNGALHPRADVARQYVKREQGGRGLISVEECVRTEEFALSDYIKNTKSGLTSKLKKFEKATSKAGYQKEKSEQNIKSWTEKPLHGQFYSRTSEYHSERSWAWLKQGQFKKETESLLMAAQDQALPTLNHKVNVLHMEGSAMCRMCGERPETVFHITSECSKIAQTMYKSRHDKVATIIHWKLCEMYGFDRADKWYEHRAKDVVENQKAKLLWDFSIQTDRVIEARRPDITLVDKEMKATWIIDIAVPGDIRVKEKEKEKIEKYQDIALEIRRMWNTSATVVPIVVGSLGMINKLTDFLGMLGLPSESHVIQKTAMIGTASILRKVLSIPA